MGAEKRNGQYIIIYNTTKGGRRGKRTREGEKIKRGRGAEKNINILIFSYKI